MELFLSIGGMILIIGIDAYYPLGNIDDPPLDQLRKDWIGYAPSFKNLSDTWKLPILFTEIGYESKQDTAKHPWEASGPLDIQAQTNAYQAVYDVIFPQDWFGGIFFWAWGTNPKEGGPNDNGFTPHNKPSEGIVRRHSLE